jgi:antitoxin MazE
MADARIVLDREVDVREWGGCIIVEPLEVPVDDLETLLEKAEPEIFPEDWDFGPALGKEVWRAGATFARRARGSAV